ncbi:hypothetical protein CEXT_221891 [Caerostris extrusa]|uniref:Uncharacterized protein n=1 Tax=Caerostris extrusa TaxID=172846 RepID=A0AAV4XDX3_CAEEX|nr:hypothetical protein CEXT_221891 [Caerostris extrusa]
MILAKCDGLVHHAFKGLLEMDGSYITGVSDSLLEVSAGSNPAPGLLFNNFYEKEKMMFRFISNFGKILASEQLSIEYFKHETPLRPVFMQILKVSVMT